MRLVRRSAAMAREQNVLPRQREYIAGRGKNRCGCGAVGRGEAGGGIVRPAVGRGEAGANRKMVVSANTAISMKAAIKGGGLGISRA